MQAAFNFKSTRLDALLVQPQSNDAAALAAQWQQQADKYRTFAAMPLVLDLDALDDAEKLDIAAVCALFKQHGFTPVALRHSKRDWEKTAAANHLLFVAADKAKAKEPAQQPENGDGATDGKTATTAQVQPESAAQDAPKQPEQDQPEQKQPEKTAAPAPRKTVVVSAPVRTGQQVYAEGADLIVLGMVSEGAEVIADGNIHIYAPLRGRAQAGQSGDKSARIFVQSMQAELVSVAGIYRVFEQKLPPHLHRRAVCVELEGGERLAVRAIEAQ